MISWLINIEVKWLMTYEFAFNELNRFIVSHMYDYDKDFFRSINLFRHIEIKYHKVYTCTCTCHNNKLGSNEIFWIRVINGEKHIKKIKNGFRTHTKICVL